MIKSFLKIGRAVAFLIFFKIAADPAKNFPSVNTESAAAPPFSKAFAIFTGLKFLLKIPADGDFFFISAMTAGGFLFFNAFSKEIFLKRLLKTSFLSDASGFFFFKASSSFLLCLTIFSKIDMVRRYSKL